MRRMFGESSGHRHFVVRAPLLVQDMRIGAEQQLVVDVRDLPFRGKRDCTNRAGRAGAIEE